MATTTLKAGGNRATVIAASTPFSRTNIAEANVRGGAESDADTLAKLDAKKPDIAEAETITGAWTVSSNWSISGDWAFSGSPVFSGSPDFSTADNKATIRADLGVEIGADVQAWDADLDVLAANPLSAAELQQLQNIDATSISGAQWGYLGAATAFAGSLLDDADAGTARATLGLVIGTDVQGQNAALDNLVSNPLTPGELQQLQNIGAETIGATQWGYVAELNQGLSDANDVTFASVSSAGDATVNGVTVSPAGALVGQALGYPNSASTVEPFTPAGSGDVLQAENVITVNSLAALKTLSAGLTSNGWPVDVRYRSNAGDNGGGRFVRSTELGVRGPGTITDGGSGYPDGSFRVALTGGNGSGASAFVRVVSEVRLEDGNGDPALPSDGDTVTITYVDRGTAASPSDTTTAVTFEFDDNASVGGGNTSVTIASSGDTDARVAETIKNLRDAVMASSLGSLLVADRKNIRSDVDGIGVHNILGLTAVPESAGAQDGDTILVTKSGTNVAVMSGEIAAVQILEPGSGYDDNSTVSLSTTEADWKALHQNDIATLEQADVTFYSTPSAATVTFALSDDIFSVRNTDGTAEYLREWDGYARPEWAGATADMTTDDSAALQNLIVAMMTGTRSLVERYGGGASGTGGTVWLGNNGYWLGGSRIYVNMGGNRHGGEAVGIKIEGASRHGAPRSVRPDPHASGAKLLGGIISFGMLACPNGNQDFISKALSIRHCTIVGGVELFAVQQAPTFEDVHIVPSYPLGYDEGYTSLDGLSLTARTGGAGVVAYDSSTIDMNGVFISGGERVLSLGATGLDDDGRFRLDGMHVINSNLINFNTVAISACWYPIRFMSPDGENPTATFSARNFLSESCHYEMELFEVNSIDMDVQVIASTGAAHYDMETRQDIEAITLPSGSEVSMQITGHGYDTGDFLYFTDVGGTTELNKKLLQITKTDNDNFTIDGTDGDDFTAYTSGGTTSKQGSANPRIRIGYSDHSPKSVKVRNASLNATPFDEDDFPDAGIGIQIDYAEQVYIEPGIFTNFDVAADNETGATTAALSSAIRVISTANNAVISIEDQEFAGNQNNIIDARTRALADLPKQSGFTLRQDERIAATRTNDTLVDVLSIPESGGFANQIVLDPDGAAIAVACGNDFEIADGYDLSVGGGRILLDDAGNRLRIYEPAEPTKLAVDITGTNAGGQWDLYDDAVLKHQLRATGPSTFNRNRVGAHDFVVHGSAYGLLTCDAGNNRVGIALGGSDADTPTLPSHTLDVAGDANVESGAVYRVNGTQVVTSQQAAIADLNQTISDPPTQAEVQAISDKIDAVLAMLRTHGLIAT